MRTTLIRFALVAVLASIVVVAESAVPAGAAVPCAVTAQRSSTPADDAAWQPQLSADGSVLVFVSDADIEGLNPAGTSEVFRVANGVVAKLTSNPGSADIESLDISADGSRVVFSSAGEISGLNDDGVQASNEEIFLWDADDTVTPLELVTSTEGLGNYHPDLSADGNFVAFDSEQNWADNAAEEEHIFIRDLSGGPTIKVSGALTGDGKVVKPSISDDGDVVVFESERGISGSNADGNIELFRYVVSTDTLTQITDTEPAESQEGWQGSYLPAVDGDGSTVVFETEVAHGTLNTDLGFEVMRWDNGVLTQLTDGAVESFSPSVSADGTRTAFLADSNLVGQNGDGNVEVFLHHGGTIRQITRTTGGEADEAQIARNGNHIAFGSDRNLMGQNGDGSYEVFVATCAPVLTCDGQPVTVVLGQNAPTAGNDVIWGTRGDDAGINGKAGNDRFCGFGGRDGFSGGGGNDRFFGGPGNDLAVGGDGNDLLKGDAGDDSLVGDAGSDTLRGGTDNDALNGGSGPASGTLDFCYGDQNQDTAINCERRFGIP